MERKQHHQRKHHDTFNMSSLKDALPDSSGAVNKKSGQNGFVKQAVAATRRDSLRRKFMMTYTATSTCRNLQK